MNDHNENCVADYQGSGFDHGAILALQTSLKNTSAPESPVCLNPQLCLPGEYSLKYVRIKGFGFRTDTCLDDPRKLAIYSLMHIQPTPSDLQRLRLERQTRREGHGTVHALNGIQHSWIVNGKGEIQESFAYNGKQSTINLGFRTCETTRAIPGQVTLDLPLNGIVTRTTDLRRLVSQLCPNVQITRDFL